MVSEEPCLIHHNFTTPVADLLHQNIDETRECLSGSFSKSGSQAILREEVIRITHERFNTSDKDIFVLEGALRLCVELVVA